MRNQKNNKKARKRKSNYYDPDEQTKGIGMSQLKIIAGLGNPGSEYANTRHNVGFRVIDELAEHFGVAVKKKKFGAVFGQCEFSDKKLILLKPWNFMNRSGQAVATAAGFYKADLEDVLVITDDMALEPGMVRIRSKGSSGGHNGLADVIEKLGTDEINRLRIGIGDSGRIDDVDFVLGQLNGSEETVISAAIENARDAVLCWLEKGIDAAMNEFNSVVKEKKEDIE